MRAKRSCAIFSSVAPMAKRSQPQHLMSPTKKSQEVLRPILRKTSIVSACRNTWAIGAVDSAAASGTRRGEPCFYAVTRGHSSLTSSRGDRI